MRLEVDLDIKSDLTIKDIARMAGVSHSTVSRALNDNPRISGETRDRIKSIAQRLNFEFNASARSLSSRHTGIIGVIYNSGLEAFGSSLYTNQLFLDLRHSLESHQLDSILLQPYNPATGNSNIMRLIRQKKVDGFLIVATSISREEYEFIRRSGIPVVQLHLHAIHYAMDDLDYFVADNVFGGCIACDHLLDTGCRRILTLSFSHSAEEELREFRERTEGYRLAQERRGLPFDPSLVVGLDDCSFEAGYSLVHARPQLFEGIDGIFAQADIVAVGCIAALKERGLKVPGDVKVIGFDDCSICGLSQPAVSSVHQPREELSRLACQRIDELLDHPPGERTHAVIEPTLVVRGSTDPDLVSPAD
jgi:LacI family transcriptional regulator